jgi:methylmalonyl-CoA mutase cobalamin-binding subunit
MENEVLGAAADTRGAVDPGGEAAQLAMDAQLPVVVVCRVLGGPRSSSSARRAQLVPGPAGPGPSISDPTWSG